MAPRTSGQGLARGLLQEQPGQEKVIQEVVKDLKFKVDLVNFKLPLASLKRSRALSGGKGEEGGEGKRVGSYPCSS